MGLIGNHSVLNKSHAFFTNGTATAGAYAANTRSNWTNPSVLSARKVNLPAKTSIGEGYNLHDALVIGPWKSGGLASNTRIEGTGTLSGTLWEVKLAQAALTGTGTVSNAALSVLTQGAATIAGTGTISNAALIAVSSLASALSGSGSITNANLSATVPLAASLAGSSTLSPSLKGYGSLSASIQIGQATGLSASDVWNYDISAINTAGTAGDALNNASSAGNPWSAELVDNNDPGTFGAFVQKLLTVAKFLGLK